METKNLSFDQLPMLVCLMSQKLDKLVELSAKQSAGEADQNELLTIDQAAKLLKLAKQTLYGKISRNEIPVHKPAGSKRVYFYKQSLLDYINTGRKKTLKEYEETATDCLISKSK